MAAYCHTHGIPCTRSRPYHKNDQAWVEQEERRGGAPSGRTRKTERAWRGQPAQCLYESARLYVNFFQPSFKLANKQRNRAQVHKRYYPPLTPYQRLLASDAVDEAVKRRLPLV